MTLVDLPAFQDAHVHLALIDPATLVAGGISLVIDLGGWLPATGAETGPETSGKPASGEPAANHPLPHISYAGQFLTAPGGYPSQQSWAPAGSSREVESGADAVTAVDLQADAGASVIKVTLNSVAGPVLQPDVLAAIVTRAHDRGLPVVAHTEGTGQAMAAHLAGVDALAHTPFTERLSDDLIAVMAQRMTWISTLDIHGWGEYGDDFEHATDNLRRFNAQGGRVLYGTDLGNGPLPVGLNRREIAALQGAGLSPEQIIAALCAEGISPSIRISGATSAPRPALSAEPPRTTVLASEQPADPAAFATWLCTARALTATEREELR